MTESDYTRQVIRALRQRLPHGVTFKHADLFTMGVPDFTVTVKRCTNWLEGKKLGPETVTDGFVILRPARHVPAVQWETLRRLGRGHLVIYTDYGHAITHVKGLRESVTLLRLLLVSMKLLVDRIVMIAEQGDRYDENQEW